MSLLFMRSVARVTRTRCVASAAAPAAAAAATACWQSQSRCVIARSAAPAAAARSFSTSRTLATSASSAASATASSASSSSASSSAAAPDAEPMNPEDYAARHGFTDDDDGLHSGGEGSESEIPYRPSDPDPERTAMQKRLLTASLPFVLESGEWSLDCLRRGAQSLGLSPAAVGMIGGDPLAELVWFVQGEAQRSMEEKYAAEASLPNSFLRDAPTSQKLHRAVALRLQSLSPYLSLWPQALAIVSSTPSRLSHSLCLHFEASSALVHLIGDTSTDSQWYVKRGLVASILTSTELYWITDRSPGHASTLRFLSRQIDLAREAAAVPEALAQASKFACNLGATLFQRCGVPGRAAKEKH